MLAGQGLAALFGAEGDEALAAARLLAEVLSYARAYMTNGKTK